MDGLPQMRYHNPNLTENAMNMFEQQRQKVVYEMERGEGGTIIYPYAIALEPPFSAFTYEVKHPHFFDFLFDKSEKKPSIEKATFQSFQTLRICPSSEEKGSSYLSGQWLASLSMRGIWSFEVIAFRETISFQLSVPVKDVHGAISQTLTHFPQSEVYPATDLLKEAQIISPFVVRCYRLKTSHFFPITSEFKTDPFRSLIGALESVPTGACGGMQVLFTPVKENWKNNIALASRDEFDNSRSPFYDIADLPKIAEHKVSKPFFAVSLRLFGSTNTILDRLESFFTLYESENGFIPLKKTYPSSSIRSRTNRSTGMLLNAGELSALAHIPGADALTKKVETARHSAPAPKRATKNSLVILGTNQHRGVETEVGISEEWLTRHVALFGGTGTGKTTALSHFLNIINNGYGCAFIDPNGDAAEEFLSLIPQHRLADTIYCNFTDRSFPPAFNILDASDQREKEMLCSDVLVSFEKFFADGWGPRMEWILRSCTNTLLYSDGEKTLRDIPRLLLNPNYRQNVIATVDDPDIRAFWETRFSALPKGAIDPIINKLSKFVDNPIVRNIIAQKNKLDFFEMINSGKIVIANVSKGALGEDAAFLLGSFLLSKFQIATMARASIPRAKRKLYTLIVDEFQNFAGSRSNVANITSLVSEARKYRVALVVATQMTEYLHRDISAALLGNIGTLIVLRCGVNDALYLQKQLGQFTAQDLQDLPVGQAIIRMERATDSFNASLHKMRHRQKSYKDEIIKHSRKNFCRPLEEVERALSTSAIASGTNTKKKKTQSIETLLVQEKTFLECVFNNPTLSVTKLYKAQSLSAYMGDRLKRKLKENGLLTEVETHLGIGSRVAKYLFLTKKGFDALPQQHVSLSGKGGQLHRYWQSVLNVQAESNGFKATIEEQIPGRRESVDLGIEKQGKRIAVEISVTTSANQELQNIIKCLNAGYHRVITLTTEEKKMTEIQDRIEQEIPENERQKVSVGLVYDFCRFIR